MTAGGGILHIEAPPEQLVDERRPVPRLPAVGEPARALKMTAPRYQDIRGSAGRAADLAGRRRAAPGHRRRGRRARRPGHHAHADHAAARHRCSPAPSSTCPGSPTSTRWSTCWPAAAPSAPSAGRSAPASWRCSAPATRSRVAADAAQDSRQPGARRAHPRRPADPRAGGALRPVRDEHPGRAGPGVRGLPGRPARRDPRPSACRTPTAPTPARPDPGTRRRLGAAQANVPVPDEGTGTLFTRWSPRRTHGCGGRVRTMFRPGPVISKGRAGNRAPCASVRSPARR